MNARQRRLIQTALLVLLLGLGVVARGPRAGDPDWPHSSGDGSLPVPSTSRTAPGNDLLVTSGPTPRPSQLPTTKLDLVWSRALAGVPQPVPIALAVDQHGRFYIVDAGAHSIIVLDHDGRVLRRWGGQGNDVGEFRFQRPGPCVNYGFGVCPPDLGGGIAVDGQGSVYVADYGNHRVQQFDVTGRFLRAWGREGSDPGALRLPSGIAVDEQGRLFVVDSGNHRVQVFDSLGALLTWWGDKGLGQGRFRFPTAVTVDEQGRVFVADPSNGLVQVFDRTGRFVTQWRTFDQPGQAVVGREEHETSGIALDHQGRLLVTGPASRIWWFNHAGRVLENWDGDWRGEGRLQQPTGIVVDAQNDLYVLDRDTGYLHRFRLLIPVTS